MVASSPTPEPPKQTGPAPDNTIMPNVVLGSSSDSEDEQILINHEGYELLSQHPEDEEGSCPSHIPGTSDGLDENESHQEEQESSASVTSVLTTPSNNEEAQNEELVERAQLWSGVGGRDNVPMDEERAQQVREAMAGFTLPSSAVPAWASDIPEDQWRAKLEERLRTIHGHAESACLTSPSPTAER